MKRIFIGLCVAVLLGWGLDVQGQDFVAATADQAPGMLERIQEASARMQSLVCDFEQSKSLSILNEVMVSKGKMAYRNDRCLRWEYVTPYVYTFVLNGQQVLMQAENSRQVLDVASSRFMQEIVQLMMDGISGKGIADSRRFKSSFYRSERLWRVDLAPLQRELKQMFSLVQLTFNVSDYSVEQVVMVEGNGDKTTITLSAKRFNIALDDARFAVD
jgi:outer membrane lipoprotein-sorting protein